MAKASANGKPANGKPDGKLTLTEMREMIVNMTSFRAEMMKQFFDPRRNIAHECGYPQSNSEITAQLLQDLYDMEAIPARVCEVWPKESWQVQPEVYELEDPDTITPFELAWDALGRGLQGEPSYYKDEAGSAIWEYLLRADILSGIGSYGVIYLGLDDLEKGSDALSKPAVPSPNRKLLFMRCFPESMASISRLETNVNSPRHGQPIEYSLTFNDPREQHGIAASTISTANVHWSRILHVADTGHTAGASEVFAVPRMRPVLRRLLDLQKEYSADGEGYWKNAFAQLFFETHPQLGGDVDVDRNVLRDMMEEMQNGLQRWGALMGMSAKTLPPQIADPTSHVNIQIEAICIKLGIPKRVFMGSERGELASSQDDQAWNDRLRARQRYYITPRIIAPFVGRLIRLGVLPKPTEVHIDWPDLTSQTKQEKATVAATLIGALTTYIQGGGEQMVAPIDLLTRFLGFTDDEAIAMLENSTGEQGELIDEDGEGSPPDEDSKADDDTGATSVPDEVG